MLLDTLDDNESGVGFLILIGRVSILDHELISVVPENLGTLLELVAVADLAATNSLVIVLSDLSCQTCVGLIVA